MFRIKLIKKVIAPSTVILLCFYVILHMCRLLNICGVGSDLDQQRLVQPWLIQGLGSRTQGSDQKLESIEVQSRDWADKLIKDIDSWGENEVDSSTRSASQRSSTQSDYVVDKMTVLKPHGIENAAINITAERNQTHHMFVTDDRDVPSSTLYPIHTEDNRGPWHRILREVFRGRESVDEHSDRELEELGLYKERVNTASTEILDLKPIKFLKNFRNPCWVEPLPSGDPYGNNRFAGRVEQHLSSISRVWKTLFKQWQKDGLTHRVRCLPYFMIGGFPKCGTTDVYAKLHIHQDIDLPVLKEPHYWTRWRHWTDTCFYDMFLCSDGHACIYNNERCNGRNDCSDGSDELGCEPPGDCSVNNGNCSHMCSSSGCSCPERFTLDRDKKTCRGGVPLSDYVDIFDQPSETILTRHRVISDPSGEAVGFHPSVTGEGTPATFWDNHRWMNESSNMGIPPGGVPNTLTAHLLSHLLPELKMIVMVRNPVDRLFSDYAYFRSRSVQHFHSQVLRGISEFQDCLRNFSLRACVYMPLHPSRPPEGRFWKPVERIRIGLYSVYIEDWLTVYNSSYLHVARLEDYKANKTDTLAKIVDFLGLDSLEESRHYMWNKTGVVNPGRYSRMGTMLPETRQELNKFYRPYNQRLAEIMNDSKFLYEE